MNITIKCSDCGQQLTTMVILGKKQDAEIEIHACFHGQRYGKDTTCTEEKEKPNETK